MFIWESREHKRQYRWRWHPIFPSALMVRSETWSTQVVQQQFAGLFQPRGTKTKRKSPHNQCSVSLKGRWTELHQNKPFRLPSTNFHCSESNLQDHTSQDHFCSVINEFPVWNSKSFKPRWWDTVPHPEREADLKLQCFWSLMIAHCSIMSSDGWGIVWVAYLYIHLSSTCIATRGGADSPFFRVCIQLLLS